METNQLFKQTYSTPSDLVQLLQSRGLIVNDEKKAEHYISHIGYFRLTGYMYPLLSSPKSNKLFKEGATFEQVMMLYRFDKKLRLLLFNEIEKIEVAIRSTLVQVACEVTGDSFWMTDEANFLNLDLFSKTKLLIEDELNHTREDFISRFREQYSDPFPPAWMLVEILPFGVITKLYSNLKNQRIKKRIAQTFGLQRIPFESWLTIIAVTRNSCCHHARVWNRIFSIVPTWPSKVAFPWLDLPTNTRKVYFDLCVVKYFLNVVSPGNDMLNKMQALFALYPKVDLRALGFPNGNWQDEPLWAV